VPPGAITSAGIVFGAGAGAALALLRPGPVAGLTVAALLAVRLGCANLDGGVARDGDRATPFGSVLNEAGDRAAELAALAGCLAFGPAALVLAAALAATLPSWVALAGAAAGFPRIQGGPVGKTERCLLLALLAFLGHPVVFLSVLAAGSALTAMIRLVRIWAGAR
jgi:CDP-diacylglycerol--glycerol-3-phosphate 3-phosphatidyltransferase